MLKFLFIIWLSFSFQVAFATHQPPLSGKSALNGESLKVDSGKRGMVVTFLSAVCPCSNSHLVELKKLHKEYPDFNFVGVHSNTDESKELTMAYFKGAGLPFPVLQDTGSKIADAFKALKTPHAFIVLKDGTVVYQGGVSSSSDFEYADQKFLREALADVVAGKKVKTASTRALGCTISRGGSNDW